MVRPGSALFVAVFGVLVTACQSTALQDVGDAATANLAEEDLAEGSSSGEGPAAAVRIRPIPWVDLPARQASFLVTNATGASVYLRKKRPALLQQPRPPLPELPRPRRLVPACGQPPPPVPALELPAGSSTRVECSLSYIEASIGVEYWTSAESVRSEVSQIAWSDWFQAPVEARADILVRHSRLEQEEDWIERWKRVRDRVSRVPAEEGVR